MFELFVETYLAHPNLTWGFFSLVLTSILFLVTIKSWSLLSGVNKSIEYSSVQRIHLEETPRLAGIIIYIGFVFYWFGSGYSFFSTLLGCILISSIPLLATSLKEDLCQDTPPIQRLIAILFSAGLFLYLYDGLIFPSIDLPFLSIIFNNYYLTFIFFAFAITSHANGVNMIDGANGLAGMTIFSQIAGIAFLSFASGDADLTYISLFLLSFVFIFLLFNYPWGKIFLGDTGAYFFGFISGILCIIFFGRHPELSPWNAILLLFYPVMETIFSTFRKLLFEKSSPLQPDQNHLHLKLFFVIEASSVKRSRIANGLVMPFLSIIWLTPIALLPWVYFSPFLIMIALLILIIIYCGFYWALPRKIDFIQKT
jgi:UDP-GlcNAc:undecaprenyl-phosphate/decaprenyl-phosphate GlcNAc-1-phosphate transferase